MEEHAIDIVHLLVYLFGGVVALSLGLFGWFLKREVKLLDDRQTNVENDLKDLKKDYMTQFQNIREELSMHRLQVMEKLHRIELLIIGGNNHIRGTE